MKSLFDPTMTSIDIIEAFLEDLEKTYGYEACEIDGAMIMGIMPGSQEWEYVCDVEDIEGISLP